MGKPTCEIKSTMFIKTIEAKLTGLSQSLAKIKASKP